MIKIIIKKEKIMSVKEVKKMMIKAGFVESKPYSWKTIPEGIEVTQ